MRPSIARLSEQLGPAVCSIVAIGLSLRTDIVGYQWLDLLRTVKNSAMSMVATLAFSQRGPVRPYLDLSPQNPVNRIRGLQISQWRFLGTILRKSLCCAQQSTAIRWSVVTKFLDTRRRQEDSDRISGSCFDGLRLSGSRPPPLQWRRRELALDTSQAYHPRVVCATAIISQSSSLLPRRPTARAIHRRTDAHMQTQKEADTQTDQETEAACMFVRCALCLCVRARHAWKEEDRVLQNKDWRLWNLVVFVGDPTFSIRRLTSFVAAENVVRKVWPTKGQWRRICIELEVMCVSACVRVLRKTVLVIAYRFVSRIIHTGRRNTHEFNDICQVFES